MTEHIDPKTVYDQAAQDYREHMVDPALSPLHDYYEKPAMHALLPALGGLSIINLGCGTGEDAQWLTDAGATKVTAIDLSEGQIAIAQHNYPTVDFKVMDISKLDYPDESFDVAYSSLTMHYVRDWGGAFNEVHRILKNGGRFIFSCIHPLESALDYSVDEQQRQATYGRVISNSDQRRTIVGDYLSLDESGIRPIKRTIAGIHEVEYYHRPFSVMVRSILAGQFTIAGTVEPAPDERMKKDNPEHYKQVYQQPKFIIWDLRKGSKNI